MIRPKCSYLLGRPHSKVTPNSANKLFTQFKATFTSSECKIFDVISETLTFAGDTAFWGAVWGVGSYAYFALRQEKGAYLKLPRSTSALGYKHYKCYIILLQGRIWGRGTGKAGEWEALTQGTQGEKTEKICRSTPAASFNPVPALRVAGLNIA